MVMPHWFAHQEHLQYVPYSFISFAPKNFLRQINCPTQDLYGKVPFRLILVNIKYTHTQAKVVVNLKTLQNLPHIL